MTLVNPKPLGYAFGELLPSAHVNSVWSQLALAIDGRGGTYTLSSPLVINGAQPIQFGAELECSGDATFSNDTFLNGPVYVYGQSGFLNRVYFQTGSDPEFDAPSTFKAAATFEASATFEAATTVLGLLASGGGASFFGSVVAFNSGSNPSVNAPSTFNDESTYNAPLKFGPGGYRKRRTLHVTSTLVPISPLNYDTVRVESTYATNGPWAVNVAGVGDGAVMRFVTKSTAEIYLTIGSVGVVLTTTPGADVSGLKRHIRAEFHRVGGSWIFFDGTPT